MVLVVVLFVIYGMGWFSLYGDEYCEFGKYIVVGVGFVLNWVLWIEVGYFD